MKKIMFVGRTGCGKTTLTQVLQNEEIDYKKTQAIEFFQNTIDTPGEYIENRAYYRALIVSSSDCDIIGLIQDCNDEECIFPPSFGCTFAKPVVGIITKVDLCEEERFIERAEMYLKDAGAEQVFKISSISKEGIEDIKAILV